MNVAADPTPVIVNVPNSGTTTLVAAAIAVLGTLLVQWLLRTWKKRDDTAAADRAFRDKRQEERERRSDQAAEAILSASDIGIATTAKDPEPGLRQAARSVWAREIGHLLDPAVRERVEAADQLVEWSDSTQQWTRDSGWLVATTAMRDIKVVLGAALRGEPLPPRDKKLDELDDQLEGFLQDLFEQYAEHEQARQQEERRQREEAMREDPPF